MNISILCNPAAGRGRGRYLAQQLQTAVQQAEHDCQIHFTTSADHVRRTAEDTSQTSDVIAVIGGDGTLHDVVNAMTKPLPLLVCPAGTANVLAKEFNLPKKPQQSAALLKAMHVTDMDLGLVSGRKFFLMLSAGFDANIIHRLADKRTGAISVFSYLSPLLQSLRHFQHSNMRVICDGKLAFEGNGTVIAANLSGYAGRFQIAPAVVDDGLLDVVVLPANRNRRYLTHLFHLSRQQHLSKPGVLHLRAKTIRIESDQPLPTQVDGEKFGHSPCDISVLPKAMRLITHSTTNTTITQPTQNNL